MPGTRRAAAAVVLLAAATMMTGCVQVQGCPGWAGYATPHEAADSADAVAVGRVDEVVATEQLHGATGNVWSFEVDEWLKGAGPDRIEVLSPPGACGQSDDPYLGVDPFESATEDSTSVVFLSGSDRSWMAISPGQGIIEMPADERLPEAWPAPAE